MTFIKGGDRRRIALAASAALAVAAVCLFGIWHTEQIHPPQPSAASTIPANATHPHSAPPSAVQKPVALPTAVSIPAIGVSHSLATVGLNPDGTLQVPPLSDVSVPAWYSGGPRPGAPGPAIIVGHVDSATSGRGVFFDLGALHIGDEVDVARADGTTARFRVTSVTSVPKTAFPTSAVYGNTPDPELRVITCGGQFDRKTGHYLSNTIVFATLIA